MESLTKAEYSPQGIEGVRVTCVVPTLNEQLTIGQVIEGLWRANADEVLIVDSSSDDTIAVAKKLGANVIIETRMGKGVALKSAFKVLDSAICVIIDGDYTYLPEEMPALVKPILEGKADVVLGSRFLGTINDHAMPALHKFGNRIFTMVVNLLFSLRISDSQTGYRALNRKAILALDMKSDGFNVETEMIIAAAKTGLRIAEVPINYRPRQGSASKLRPLSVGWSIIRTILNAKLSG